MPGSLSPGGVIFSSAALTWSTTSPSSAVTVPAPPGPYATPRSAVSSSCTSRTWSGPAPASGARTRKGHSSEATTRTAAAGTDGEAPHPAGPTARTVRVVSGRARARSEPDHPRLAVGGGRHRGAPRRAWSGAVDGRRCPDLATRRAGDPPRVSRNADDRRSSPRARRRARLLVTRGRAADPLPRYLPVRTESQVSGGACAASPTSRGPPRGCPAARAGCAACRTPSCPAPSRSRPWPGRP